MGGMVEEVELLNGVGRCLSLWQKETLNPQSIGRTLGEACSLDMGWMSRLIDVGSQIVCGGALGCSALLEICSERCSLKARKCELHHLIPLPVIAFRSQWQKRKSSHSAASPRRRCDRPHLALPTPLSVR